MKSAVQKVLTDDGFTIPSPPARKAIETAEQLLEWLLNKENDSLFSLFAVDLVEGLEGCFKYGKTRSLKKRREKMWESLFKLRSTQNFRSKWSDFLQSSISVPASPIFYQYVVDTMFDVLLKQRHRIEMPEEVPMEESFSYEEINALRYTSGSVIRAVKKKLKRSANPKKEHLIACLSELHEHVNEKPTDDDDDSNEWMSLIDRGGLTHIGNVTFCVFGAMELQVKNFFSRHPTQLGQVKQELQSNIYKDDDVQSYWALVSGGWGTSETKELLELIIDHYITIRGFSFASGWMEKYKQATKKSTQKSKGLRKQLTDS